MEQYEVVKRPEPFSWDKVKSLHVAEVLWLPDKGIQMEQKICYDKNAIYVFQYAHEKNIRSEEEGPLCPVCQDSCMEFFFRPEKDDRYMNIEINPNGSVNCGLGKARRNRIRLVVADYSEVFKIKTDRKEEEWAISYRIPLSFLQVVYPDIELETGTVLYANCYKCGDKTEDKHYLSWNPVNSAKPDFHRPEDFGRLVFG